MSGSTYHHGRLRAALVEEAVAVARAEGPERLGVRELARRIGVSPTAAYRHFAKVDDLVAVVAGHAMTALEESMRDKVARVEDTDDPVLLARRRLAGVGRAYVEFALAEPGLFRVALKHRARSGGNDKLNRGAYHLLGEVLDELEAVGYVSRERRVGAEILCSSVVHGFALLTLDGVLAHGSPEGLDRALDLVLVGLDRSLGM